MVNNLIVPLVILLFLFAVRVPFYIALFSVTVYLQLFVNKVGFEMIFTGLYDNLMMPSILAVPFFILTGYFVEESSIGNRLVGLVLGSVSRIRSGPAVACVVANAIFGAISGSAPAATATIGKITFKQLEEAYDEKIALGLIVSSGSLSTIIPPSISMILYGIATEISIGRLFIAGFIPGIVIVIIVSAYFVFLGKPAKHTKLNDLQPSHKEKLPVISACNPVSYNGPGGDIRWHLYTHRSRSRCGSLFFPGTFIYIQRLYPWGTQKMLQRGCRCHFKAIHHHCQ